MVSNSHQERMGSTRVSRATGTTAATNMNASGTFRADVLDSQKKMDAAGESSCVTCFGEKQSVPTMGKPSQAQMEGKKFLRALSALSCISLRSLSSPTSSSSSSSTSTSSSSSERKSSSEAEAVMQKATAGDEQKANAIDQQILLRIMMWGGPNTLLLLAPFDAPAEFVIEMVLDSYAKGVGLQECRNFELFCAHCNSPALHPKQPIGSVGSRHFLLCKKGLQISGVSIFNSHPQTSQSSSSSARSHSSPAHAFKHSRSLSQGNSFLSPHSSSVTHSHHRRSNSWWNPAQCLTVGQH